MAESREGVDLDHVLEGRTVSAVRYTDPHLQGHLEKETPDRITELKTAQIQQKTQICDNDALSQCPEVHMTAVTNVRSHDV